MINQNQVQIFVGLFVVLGGLSLAFLALQVSGLTTFNERESYKLSARFDNIAGLNARARVSVAGVTIGRVVRTRYDKDLESAIVDMDIDKKYSGFSTDTSASILTSGLLGEKYIGLVNGIDGEALKDGDLIYDTQSSIVLEELISRFLMNLGN